MQAKKKKKKKGFHGTSRRLPQEYRSMRSDHKGLKLSMLGINPPRPRFKVDISMFACM